MCPHVWTPRRVLNICANLRVNEVDKHVEVVESIVADIAPSVTLTDTLSS